MKALITGASGFVGSAVTKRLIADGHHVRPFVRNPKKLKEVGLDKDLDVEVVVPRPMPIYGADDTRLLKLFKTANKPRMVMLGPGTAGYHPVHSNDLANAFLLAATAEDITGEAFIVGGDQRLSLNDLVRPLADILGHGDQKIIRLPAGPVRLAGHLCEFSCRPLNINPPIYRRRVDFFANNRAYDVSKAKSMLGYNPKVTTRKGLQQTAVWYRSDHLL